MDCATSSLEPWDRCTGVPAPGPGASPLLALLLRGRQVAACARLGEGRLLVGRSAECHLRVEDPAFHRVAGEIHRAPSLVFRPRREGIPVQELVTGRPLPLGGYHLLLLEEGATYFNRAPVNARRRSWGVVLLLSLLVLGLSGAAAYRGRALHPATAAAPHPLPALLKLPAPSSPPPAAPPPRGAAPSLQTAANAAPEPPPPAEAASAPGGVSPEAFLRVVSLSRSALEQGEPRRAGTLLSPLWPLLSPAQRAAAAGTLDPVALRLFQRGYLVAPYDPAVSGSIFRALAGSGLPPLASVDKAVLRLKGAPHVP